MWLAKIQRMKLKRSKAIIIIQSLYRRHVVINKTKLAKMEELININENTNKEVVVN